MNGARVTTRNGQYFMRETLNKLVRAFMVKDKLSSPMLESVNQLFQYITALFVLQLQYYAAEKAEEQLKVLVKKERDRQNRINAAATEAPITPRTPRTPLTPNIVTQNTIDNLPTLTPSLPKFPPTSTEDQKETKQELDRKKDIEDEAYILLETIEIIMQCKNPFYLNNLVYAKEAKILQQVRNSLSLKQIN
jgi:hypothetical protein